MIPIGTHVRVSQPIGSVFFGAIGIVVERPRRHRRSSPTNAIQFLGHPWQAKNPEASWFFDDDELDVIATDRTLEQEPT